MRRLALALAGSVLLAGCSALSPSGGEEQPAPDRADASPTVDPDAPLAWGPTRGEWDRARALVAEWSPERLAGQVIVGRFHGTDPAVPAAMVSELHLAGVSITTGNIADEAQVRAMTEAVNAAVAADGRDFPAVVGVDQEGGYVSHLRGVATDFPHFQSAGLAIQADPGLGRRVTRAAAEATGLELRDLGFTWVFAPVADVTIGSADPTIGARSPSSDPQIAAQAAAVAVRGYNRAGIVSTVKHFPGHGSATADSHDTLPEVDATLAELRARDLPAFDASIRAGAPAVMLSHLDVRAVAPGTPASMAPEIYSLLREDGGFEGVAITDSLGMGAVGGRPKPAVQALAAGADLLLMPVDTEVTHGLVAEAIRTGEVPRSRAEEAAARVVALQMWQQRVAATVPLPPDVTARAEQASQALLSAAY